MCVSPLRGPWKPLNVPSGLSLHRGWRHSLVGTEPAWVEDPKLEKQGEMRSFSCLLFVSGRSWGGMEPGEVVGKWEN